MVAVGSRRGALAFVVFEIIKLAVGQPPFGCSDTFDNELVTKLVAENLGGGSVVRLEDGPEGFRFRVVCLAAGTLAREARHYTHASIVVFHSINESEAVYGQYEFECDVQGINGIPWVWSSGFLGGLLGTSGSDNRLFPLPQPLPLRLQSHAVDCIACVNPAHSSGGSTNADPASHCLAYHDHDLVGSENYEAEYREARAYSTDGDTYMYNCTMECFNGGTVTNDSCECNCSNTVYTGDSCVVCGCLNGGTCGDSVCHCPAGFTGRLCESCVVQCGKNKQPSISNCTCECPLVCMNGGELYNDTCACDCRDSVVYSGETCNVCNCINGGWCSGNSCICPSAFTGKLCEKPQCIVPCGRNKHPANNCSCAPCNLECLNGGILRDDICACDCSPSGVYWGTDCSVCRCMNDGVCVENKCRCASKFTGQFCGTCPVTCRNQEYLTRSCSCDTCSNRVTGCQTCYRDNWWSSKVQCTACQEGYSFIDLLPGECVRGASGFGCSRTCIGGIVAINVGTLVFACIATLVVCVVARRRGVANGYQRTL